MPDKKSLLISLRNELTEIQDKVPHKAGAFHRECERLLRKADQALSWTGLFSRAERARELQDNLTRLRGRVDPLVQLLRLVEDTQARLAGLGERSAGLTHIPTRDWIALRVGEQQTALRRLGTNVKTHDDLEHDRRLCDQIREECTELIQAHELLIGAYSALQEIGPPKSAPLEAALPDLLERLPQQGPTRAWREELNALILPLAHMAQRREPREIADTDRILRDLPRWSEILDTECSECDTLKREFASKRKYWKREDDRAFVALFEQAQALEQKLMDQAARQRSEWLSDLTAQQALFKEFGRQDEALDKALRRLRDSRPGSVWDHMSWDEQFQQLKERFRAMVKSFEYPMRSRCTQDLREAEAQLERLERMPRLDEKGDRLATLRDTHRQLMIRAGSDSDAMTLLGAVEGIRRLRRDLNELETGIHNDKAALEQDRQAIQARVQALVHHAERLDVDIASSLPDPDRLAGEDEMPTSLETARQRLEQAGRDVEAAERIFADRCAELIDEKNRRSDLIGASLERLGAGRAAEGSASVDPTSATSVAVVVDDLTRAESRLERLEQRLAAEEQRLNDKREKFIEHFLSVRQEGLGAADRSEHQFTLDALQHWDPEAYPDDIERVTVLRDIIEIADRLHHRLAQQQRALQSLRGDLKQRLGRFNAMLLQRYCPEAYTRVESLIHTPEDLCWPEGAEREQLDEARRLLRDLEIQAHRLAAHQIARDLSTLEKHTRRSNDPEAEQLVRDLKALAPEQQPPAILRERLRELAASRLGEY